jgi:hypothetical protein
MLLNVGQRWARLQPTGRQEPSHANPSEAEWRAQFLPRHDGSSRLSHTRSCCCVMMLRSQSRDFLKRPLSESGRAKAIFSLCRGDAQPAST